MRAFRFIPYGMLWLLCACGAVPLHTSVPEADTDKAQIAGFPAGIRSWADEASGDLTDMVQQRVEGHRKANAAYFKKHGHYPDLHYLAISGGSYDGAFGAGLLNGWTKAGTRPDFSIVTGVSTGALIAPFVFVGPQYDDTIRELFTTTASDHIFTASLWDVLDGITGGLALTNNAPMVARIKQYITPKLMHEIAAEHAKGKRLYIGTTNIEAQRGVIWDIGAIASSGHKKSLSLIRQVMLASAAIPGAFKPVFIDVEVGDKRYNEIHMDGGVTSQVFIYPMRLKRSVVDYFKKNGLKRHLYIVRNSKIGPEYKKLEPGLFALTRRSIETLIKYEGLGDLYRLYVGAQRDGIEYNLVQIPPDFTAETKEAFDPAYMSALFARGYEMGLQKNIWAHYPPGVDYVPDANPPPAPPFGKAHKTKSH